MVSCHICAHYPYSYKHIAIFINIFNLFVMRKNKQVSYICINYYGALFHHIATFYPFM